MSGKTNYLPVVISLAVILIGMILAGCSAAGATQQETSGQAVTPPSSSTAAQPGTGTQGSIPPGRPGGPDMSKMMARAAEILGITEAKFTSAFQQAQESVFGSMPGGMPGLPPAPPSGTPGQQPPADGTGQPPQPPTGITGLPAPQGAQGPGPEGVQKVYNKMAEILSISADKIAGAIEQARQELQPAVK